MWSAMVLLAAAGLALGPAAEDKKSKSAKAGAIPARPEQLKYPPLAFEVPDASKYRHELGNGIPVYVAEDHDLPLVDVSITLRVGSFLDPADRRGLASITGAMVRRGGTTAHTAEEFDERVDFLAANMGSFTTDTSGGASFDCTTGVLDETMALFFDMLKNPRFQDDRLRVEKDNVLEDMKQRNDSPQSISGREWQWLMRGADHFSARQLTKADLDAIGRDAIVEFHKKYWRPENMIVGVSGDVNTADVLKKLEAHFASWKVEGPAVPWPPPAPTHTPTPGVYYVQKDIPQGRVLIGHPGLKRRSWEDPDEFALMVMNDILGGGGFTSRMVKRIRSDEGLAYSAGSQFGIGTWWPGIFQVSFQSKSATVPLASKIALDEIERMKAEKVGAEELTVSKNSFIDVFPRRFESAEDIVDTFVSDEYEGRPHTYWKTYRDRVRAVTADDVQRVAREYLHPDRLVFLVVGNWEAVRAGDADGRATMAQFHQGNAVELPLRDPLTLQPIR
jgi:predicted Zn-dependent peptidase